MEAQSFPAPGYYRPVTLDLHCTIPHEEWPSKPIHQALSFPRNIPFKTMTEWNDRTIYLGTEETQKTHPSRSLECSHNLSWTFGRTSGLPAAVWRPPTLELFQPFRKRLPIETLPLIQGMDKRLLK